MNKKITVSIALCTYNGARFLQEQLDSFSTQTRLPEEVVVCDDGSTDETLAILENWAASVPFEVRIVRNEKNLGFAKNFEKAVSLCTKDVVFLSDQDDIWLPEKLAHMLPEFERDRALDLLFCHGEIVDSEGQKLHQGIRDIYEPRMFCNGLVLFTPIWKKNPLCIGCCAAVRKRHIPDIFPVPEGYSHDKTFYVRIPAFGEVRTFPESLVFYRLHGKNTSFSEDWKKSCDDFRLWQKNAYRRITGLYFFKEQEIEVHHNWLLGIPESEYKRRCLRYLEENRKHYTNRSRVQRSIFIFFPFFLAEIFCGRYFQRFQPVKSICFDLMSGFLNGLNPHQNWECFKTLKTKLFRK